MPETVDTKKTKKLGALGNGLTGAILGLMEVSTTGQPLRRMTTFLQAESSIPFSKTGIQTLYYSLKTQIAALPESFIPGPIRFFYRGAGAAISSLGPTTAVQVTVDSKLNAIAQNAGELSLFQKSALGFLSGGTGAFLASPTEMIIIEQQLRGQSLSVAFKRILSSAGFLGLYRGLGATALREGTWGAFLFAMVGYVKTQFEALGMSSRAAFVLAGITSGAMAAVLSHPWDTINTRQKLHPLNAQPICFFDAYRKSVEHGFNGLFVGVTPRATRAAVALTLMAGLKQPIQEALETYTPL
ncbi:MAG: hypothetical protein EBX40_03300 [Gammaproteobacteria bacterium]|nr:hypothetical protein [Gammaproteobacteria bacterium]